jgi:hypothetical protein
MSEDKKIEDQKEDDRSPTTDDCTISAEDASFSPKKNKTVAKENTQHLTPNIQPNNESMEVHQHGHVHEKKKWKEYLFQFLMLFLAVFFGFLAEYQLEHTIEHQREKQFMISMVEDLEKDMARLQNESELAVVQYTRLDSLTQIIYKGEFSPYHIRKIYELQRRYLYPLNIKLIHRTELQLKNAGGMRLIRNKQVTDSIIDYWSTSELLYDTRHQINFHRDKAKDISFGIFNNKYYKHQVDFSLAFPLDPTMGEPKLLTRDPVVLTEFANRVSHLTDLLRFNYKLRRIDLQAGNAARLIRLIKKEYDLN